MRVRTALGGHWLGDAFRSSAFSGNARCFGVGHRTDREVLASLSASGSFGGLIVCGGGC